LVIGFVILWFGYGFRWGRVCL